MKKSVLSIGLLVLLCLSHNPEFLGAKEITIVDLQKFKSESTIQLPKLGDEAKPGSARLINLNPEINTWFLLEVKWPTEKQSHWYHLENPDPVHRLVYLDNTYANGLKILEKDKHTSCELWSPGKVSDLLDSEKAKRTYTPICEDKLFIRYETEGNETTKEWVTDFLRSHVWGGEKITTLVKDYLYKDKFLLTASAENQAKAGDIENSKQKTDQDPIPADVDPAKIKVALDPKELGISLVDFKGSFLPGKWYETEYRSGVFVSAIQPGLIDSKIFETYKDRAAKLDATENAALNYMVAFDLSKFDLGFAMGTKHPSAEWSERAPDKVIKRNIPGPDGIGNFLPLKLTGKINPAEGPLTIATFTGGFKRTHAAFKWGRLSTINEGSHYGFIENGVVFSKLQPELATVIIYKDGSVDMKTWTYADEALLPKIKHARQNGVPLIDYDPVKKESMPGSLVSSWMNGNWSGSVDSKQRALRAGACLVEDTHKKWLVYGYFSSVTPNAMARVFQAYHCKYALHLDMNALEHTYLALYQNKDKNFKIQHLITGMNVLDRKTKEGIVPRFVGTADNRDFFYVMEKH